MHNVSENDILSRTAFHVTKGTFSCFNLFRKCSSIFPVREKVEFLALLPMAFGWGFFLEVK